MINLKPCPFCGGEATLVHISRMGYDGSVVKCHGCNCQIEGKWFRVSTSYASDEKAIEAWNRRADDERFD